jgi:CheY-like chemotaxis protein
MRQRVLVVDDLAEIQVMIRRALTARGYEVDVAGSLAQAQAMNPGSYDALLVDSRLGSERGIDLVDALRAVDPAAVSRCLMMTGGTGDELPGDVACLTKPFQLGELIDAVRALSQPGMVTAPGERPGATPGAGPRPGVRPQLPPAAVGPPAAPAPLPRPDWPGSGDGRMWPLLGLVRALRARERHELAGFLHDGPIQELTAALLGVELMSRAAPSPPAVDAVRERLNAASESLRWLVDGPWPLQEHADGLASSLTQRTAWLLRTPIVLEDGEPLAGLAAAEVHVIADVVELMLFTMLPLGPPAQARATVGADDRLLRVGLALAYDPGHGRPVTDRAAISDAMDELAAALGASVQVTSSERHCRARLVLARKPS